MGASVDPWLEAPPAEPIEEARDRFEVGNPAAMAHLEEHGYVVIRNVADPEQLERAEELLFDFMGEQAGWRRGDPSSWDDDGLARCSANGLANGLINKRGAHHSELSWYVRTLPGVRRVFESVWGTSDLITSFDCFGLFRPWHTRLNTPKTVGGWFHVDQGSPGKQCIQGLLSIFDQDYSTGGLTVIPGSHRHFEKLETPVPYV